MGRKFAVGDKVRLNARAPKYMTRLYGMRQRQWRTVVDVVVFHPKWRFALYLIGHNGMGKAPGSIWLRSYMLDKVGSGSADETQLEPKLHYAGRTILNGGRKPPVACLAPLPRTLMVLATRDTEKQVGLTLPRTKVRGFSIRRLSYGHGQRCPAEE